MSITVWRCTLWWGFPSCVLYMVMVNAEYNTWYISIIMLDGIQETNYAWLSWNIILKIQKITNRIFCLDKKFSLAGVDVKYLFYIYLAYGIRWKVGDHGVSHQCWSCSTNGIWWKVEDHGVAHHWCFVWWIIEGVT